MLYVVNCGACVAAIYVTSLLFVASVDYVCVRECKPKFMSRGPQISRCCSNPRLCTRQNLALTGLIFDCTEEDINL